MGAGGSAAKKSEVKALLGEEDAAQDEVDELVPAALRNELRVDAGNPSAWEHDASDFLAAVGGLTVSDFPMRLVFLDKSGSMSHNDTSLQALHYAYRSAAAPTRGSTLTFLLAGPGDTEFLFARAGAAAPTNPKIQLGSATWFNEPVIRTMLSIAPAVEQLLEDARRRRASLRMTDEVMEPPMQLMCLSDGADNESPKPLRSLESLVAAIGAIVGPSTGRRLYEPMSPIQTSQPLTAGQEDVHERVPVWLTWVAVGNGGRAFLKGAAVPSAVTLVDATALASSFVPPPLPAPVAETGPARPALDAVQDLDAPDAVLPGHVVRVLEKIDDDDADAAPGVFRNLPTPMQCLPVAIVLHEVGDAAPRRPEAREVSVMYKSGKQEAVLASRCRREPGPGIPAANRRPTSAPAQYGKVSRTEAAKKTCALLGAALLDPRSLAMAAQRTSDGGVVVPPTAPVPASDIDLPLSLGEKDDEAEIPFLRPNAYPDLILHVMRAMSRASSELAAEDRKPSQQAIQAVVLELMNYHTVLTSHFADRYAPSPPSSEMPPNHRACAPALALLQELAKLRVLKVAERTSTCTCNQCAEAAVVATAAIPLAYTARDPTDPALGAVLRLLQDTRTLFQLFERGARTRLRTLEAVTRMVGSSSWKQLPDSGKSE
jgi:hypothetical protein